MIGGPLRAKSVRNVVDLAFDVQPSACRRRGDQIQGLGPRRVWQVLAVTQLPVLPFRGVSDVGSQVHNGGDVELLLLHRSGLSPYSLPVSRQILTHVTAHWIARPPMATLSRDFNPAGCPARLLVSFRINRQLPEMGPSSHR